MAIKIELYVTAEHVRDLMPHWIDEDIENFLFQYEPRLNLVLESEAQLFLRASVEAFNNELEKRDG